MYQIYWRDAMKGTHTGFVKARSRDEAYDFAAKKLQKGCVITAVYKASANLITPRSICFNFSNPTDYRLF